MFQGRRSVHATPVTEKEERLALSQAEQNVEVVRQGCEAFNTANMAALTELFAEDDAWRTSGRSPIAGDHQDHHNSGERNGKQLDTDCCIVFKQTVVLDAWAPAIGL